MFVFCFSHRIFFFDEFHEKIIEKLLVIYYYVLFIQFAATQFIQSDHLEHSYSYLAILKTPLNFDLIYGPRFLNLMSRLTN